MTKIEFKSLPNRTTPITGDNLNKLNNVAVGSATPKFNEELWINGNALNVYEDGKYRSIEFSTKKKSNEYTINTNGTPLINNVVKGNSEQEVRSGKNLLNNTNANVVVTTNGITFTKNNDGSILINGTATAQAYYYINTASTPITLDSSKTYRLSGGKGDAKIEFNTSGGLLYNEATKSGITSVGNVLLYVQSGKTINNVTVYPQIEEGNTTTSYEQYGVSPSPEYPSEIKNVGICNLIPDDVELTDKYTYYPDGSYQANTNYLTFRFIKVKPNTTYVYSDDTDKIKYTSVRIFEFTNTKSWIKRGDAISNSRNNVIFTTGSTTGYIGIGVYTSSTASLNDISKYQLEPGTTTHNYVPYGNWLVEKIVGKNLFTQKNEKQKILITDSGETSNNNFNTTDFIKVEQDTNYCISEKVNDSSIFQIVISEWDNNKKLIKRTTYQDTKTGYYSIKLSNTTEYVRMSYRNDLTLHDIQLEQKSSATNYESYKETLVKTSLNKETTNLFDSDTAETFFGYPNETITSNTGNKLTYIPIKENTTYRVSKTLSSRFGLSFANDKPQVGTTLYEREANNNGTVIIKTNTNHKYLVIYYWNTTDTLTEKEILDSIKIYESSEPFPYYELNKIGNVADEIDLTTGILTRRIGKVALDGSESWDIADAYTGYTRFSRQVYPENLANNYGMNSHFTQRVTQAHGDYEYLYLQPNSKVLFIQIKNPSITNVTTFKQWLSNNNVTVYYILNTPEIIQLKPNYIIDTHDGVNYVTIESDIQPSGIDLEYYTEGSLDYPNSEVVSNAIIGLNKEIEELKEIIKELQQ